MPVIFISTDEMRQIIKESRGERFVKVLEESSNIKNLILQMEKKLIRHEEKKREV
jgi:predicted transcriptional regulator